MPDMLSTTDGYLDDTGLFDLQAVSTMGLQEEDLEAVLDTEGVQEAELSYSSDLLCDSEGEQYVVHLMAQSDMAQCQAEEGRLPEKADEIFLDAELAQALGCQIGDKITLYEEDQEGDKPEGLAYGEFEITGIGSSPMYLSINRGSASVGNGQVTGFAVVLPEAFDMEVYTQMNIRLEGAGTLECYSDEYKELVSSVQAALEETAGVQCEWRYEQIYDEAQGELADARAELEDGRATAQQELADARKELEDGEADYLEGKEEAEAQIADGEQQIADAEAELADLEQPEWYLNTRDDVVEDYGEMEDNAAQIGAIGRVFPLMFFLVAALVSLTTMTRMVEEQRGHIGTMKALGYSKKDIAMKYLFYAGSATLSGGAVGILVGQKLFPYVIQVSYGIMYDCLKQPDIPYRPVFAIQAMLISFVCIMLATGLSCMNELRESPAELMRPAAPKVGKRVLLEYIPLIWKRLNFTTKSTFRNIFRYKKRLFMTIFGISATMALLVTGFGLRDSIIDLAEIQYDNIQLYDAMITFSGTDEEKEDLGQWLEDEKDVAASTMVHMEMVDVSTEEGNGEVYLCVPENKEDFQTMTVLQNRTSEEVYTLDGEGILLTEWMADTLGVSAGDSITMEKEDGSSSQEVQVMGVVENYIMNYAYMSPQYYEKIYGEPAEFEVMYAEFTPEGQERENELGSEILQQPGVYNVSYTSDTKREINDMLQALVLVIIVLIVTAALLAFVVLYNLNNVNITERRRELATLKVLGFYDQEVAAYVYHENIILTLMGIVVGVGLGTLLHQYIIHTIRVDMVMFGQHVSLVSFLISAVLTAVFSAFVNFVMYFKLKEINMVESLKSVE